ncbi:MAG: hypothetical protein ACRD8Z_04410 [Nitrososphaeraceae archaeon]
MSYGEPVPCKNNCGAWIYFDKNSTVGHSSADKWLPLEYNHDSGIRTGSIHQCPNRPKQQQQQSPQEQQSRNPLTPVSDESVDRGISAFSMMSSLIVLDKPRSRWLLWIRS